MTSFGVGAQTKSDQQLYLSARLADVSCESCAAVVRVKKNSEHQTSIQWDQRALSTCAEFAQAESRPGGRAVYEPCRRLAASIDAAVEGGAVAIGATDGY